MRNSDWLGLTGKCAVVTGAGSGIGRGIALALSAAGCSVGVVDLDQAAAEDTVSRMGSQSLAVVADTSDRAAVHAAAARVQSALGPADVLVNNAGISGSGSLEDQTDDAWQRVFDVNLNGYLWSTQAFAGPMAVRGRGAVVNVTSICSLHPYANVGAYAPSKAAVLMMTRQLAVEWADRGVRVNAVAPGLIRTPLTEASYADPTLLAGREGLVPLGRIGSADDIADAVLYLASERAGYVTGQQILVDGGLGETTFNQVSQLGRR